MVRRSVSIALPALLFLGACAVGPEYRQPALEMPPAWPAAQTEASSPAEELVTWWHRFEDPVLDGLIERALANNLELRMGFSRVQEARVRLGLAQAERYPTVAVQSEALRQRRPGAALGIPGLDLPPRSIFSVSGALAYELDLWGRLASNQAAALAQLESSVYAHEALRIALVADVVTGYYALRGAQSMLAITERTLVCRLENVRVHRLRYEAGGVDELVLRQAEADYATVKAQLPGRMDAVQRRQSALAVLVGLSPVELVAGLDTGDPAVGGAAPVKIPAVLPAELLGRRPDLRAVEAGLRGATSRVGVAMAARLPQLNLAALAGSVVIGSPSDLFGKNSELWSVGASVSAPLLDFGRGRAGVEIAESLREQAELRYRAAVTAAVAEVGDALWAYDHSLATLSALDEQAAALRRAEALAEIRFRGGYVSLIELLDAQRARLAVELLKAGAQAEHYAAAATLFKALGGGWEAS